MNTRNKLVKEKENIMSISDEKVFEYYKKQAEVSNDPRDKNCLARGYYLGQGTDVDYEKAFYWFEKSKELVSSQYHLGLCYWFGNGVEEDFEKAVEYFEQSAESEHPISNYNLGNFYHLGLGLEQDMKKAVYYYKRSLEFGIDEEINSSIFNPVLALLRNGVTEPLLSYHIQNHLEDLDEEDKT